MTTKDQENSNPERPTVLLDVDGVLADFIGGVLDVVEHVLGRRHTHEDITEFDFCKALGIDGEDARNVKRMISECDGFCSSLSVFPGARRGVAELQAIAEVYVVTSPWNSCPTWTYEREAWLKKHFGIPHRRVIHTSAKHLVRGDVLVDDKTSTIREWQTAHPHSLAIQWETPHNRRDGWEWQSTNDWNQLRTLVQSFDDLTPRTRRG